MMKKLLCSLLAVFALSLFVPATEAAAAVTTKPTLVKASKKSKKAKHKSHKKHRKGHRKAAKNKA